MKDFTVNELKKECEKMIKEGCGEKIVLISNDDEGNGYHTLFYTFNNKEKDLRFYAENGMFHDDNNPDDVILLG